MTNVPINKENIPEEFQENDKVVKCLNYPDSNDAVCKDFNPNSMNMFGFAKINRQNQEHSNTDDSDSNIHFPELTSDVNSKNKKMCIHKMHASL